PTNSVLMAQSDDLISQATRFRQGIINATRKGTNGLSCMGLGFAACGVGLVALWFLTAPPFTS
ncbi:MAG: hypothetical protein JXB04_02705, partial [Kiritimatiellae bacterium]|nr:hypothetical protein [Kiritimatiellia bacterium]